MPKSHARHNLNKPHPLTPVALARHTRAMSNPLSSLPVIVAEGLPVRPMADPTHAAVCAWLDSCRAQLLIAASNLLDVAAVSGDSDLIADAKAALGAVAWIDGMVAA